MSLHWKRFTEKAYTLNDLCMIVSNLKESGVSVFPFEVRSLKTGEYRRVVDYNETKNTFYVEQTRENIVGGGWVSGARMAFLVDPMTMGSLPITATVTEPECDPKKCTLFQGLLEHAADCKYMQWKRKQDEEKRVGEFT